MLLAGGVFVVLLAVYSATESPLPTWDAYANVFPALSLLNDGDLSLAPSEIPFLFTWSLPATGRRLQISIWDRMIIDGTPAEELYRAGKLRPERPAYYFVTRAPGGEYVGTEPPGAALAAAPFFKWMTLPDTAASLRDVVPLVQRSKLVAAIFTAATAAIVLLTSVRYLSPLRALLVAAIFGLGTCAWSLASQALWAQTAMQPFLALGIDQFLRVRDGRGFAVTAGFALACAVCVRSTSVFVFAAIGLFLLVKDTFFASSTCNKIGRIPATGKDANCRDATSRYGLSPRSGPRGPSGSPDSSAKCARARSASVGSKAA